MRRNTPEECRDTASSTPTAAKQHTNELPPALTKGSGNPVGGTAPHTTAAFISACIVMTAVSVLILEAFWIWNDYNIAVILLNSRTTKTIQVAIHALFAQTYSQWDIALPALMISMMPIIVMNILLQKKIFAGMTAGAIKG